MRSRIAALLVALAATLAFWLVAILDMAAGWTYSATDLLTSLVWPDLSTALVAGWALSLVVALVARPKSDMLATVLMASPALLGFCATGLELEALQRGTSTFDRPEEELIMTYAPRLMAALAILGLTLSGIALQLLCSGYRARSAVGET